MKSTLLFGLAAVAASALAPGDAAAQRGSLSMRVVRHVQPAQPNFHAVGRPLEFGDGQRHRRGRGFGHGWYAGWGGVYEDPERFRDAGYFAGPADSHSDGGRVHYDYDRGYPYDWYRERSARTALPTAIASRSAERRVSCNVEAAGVRVCRGQR